VGGGFVNSETALDIAAGGGEGKGKTEKGEGSLRVLRKWGVLATWREAGGAFVFQCAGGG